MNKVSWILCFSVLMAGAAVAAPGNGRVLYKWIDSQGVTHYGDRVPPEYAGQEQHIINSQGVEVSHQDAQKSAEQLAADEKRRQDQEDRLNRDRNLLSAYASVGEIERIRDQRLTLVSDQIKVTTQFLENLNGRMKKMRVNAMHFKPYNADPKAPSMPDQVAEDLVRLSNDIHTQEQNLEQKRGEESTMKKQFENDIDRFKELKHIQ